jgi:hypothetical protein
VIWGGDAVIDSCGDQADHFRFFVAKLREFLQVPIGGADYIPIKDHKTGLQYHCSVCQRPSLPGRAKCWMCGGDVVPIIPTPDADGGEGDEPAGLEEPVPNLDLEFDTEPLSETASEESPHAQC